jgi:hypothetical protein
MWDLTHYFPYNDEEIIIQFDISYFKNLKIPEMLSSYRSIQYHNKVPDLAINVLSKSTWRKDLLDNMMKCKKIQVPFYVVYFAYEIVPNLIPPPFIRVYSLQNDEYVEKEFTKTAFHNTKLINSDAIIDLGDTIPFNIALNQSESIYQGGKPIFHLVIVKKQSNELFLSEKEFQKARADQEQARADQEQARADQEQARADRAEAKIRELEQQLKKQN